ncbi:hypothetical protein [Acinetobacter junii]|uniref:hypothetical protein n=1 Tax=Acinetobacter junii TaxID=40215 RepID=UPI0018FFA120|nr:hypothetical protein [Acinetobacter junii]MBJ8440978.1 hypothetical protein [Acinetobacter junii]
MTNILNAQEAFAALQKGKTVLCRYAGNGSLHADKDFSTLDQMPATVFALPNYEFCIQVEMIELAGIAFSKPLALDEYEDGQDVFVINTYSPSIYVVNFKTAALVESINGGFVQRDVENAKLQLKAISNALGHELNDDVSITRLGKEPSKSKRKKDAEAKIKTDDEASLDDIIGPVTAQCPTSNDVEKKTLDEIPAQSEIQTNPISFDSVAAAVVNKAKEIDEVTLENNSKKLANDDSEYQEKLATLKQRVDESKTVTEVNAVVKYTTGWTTEQISPLLKYMHKRLEVLQQNKAAEQPSLMVRIQNAPDLTSLDALEIDVSSLDPVIQPEMMRHVRNRRFELEKASSVAINDEDLP